MGTRNKNQRSKQCLLLPQDLTKKKKKGKKNK